MGITKMRSQCATKMKTVKKSQTWKAKSPIWKKCLTSLVMMANGPSVKSNPSTWVRSNAKPTNACFTVLKVSWLKATEKPNVKRTKTVNGNSTKNSVPVSNVVMTVQKSRCQKCQRSPKMKKNQKTKKKNQKTKKKSLKTKKKNLKMKKKQVKPKVFLEMTANGKNANPNQLKMVISLVRMLSAFLNVKKASWSKVMPKQNAKRIRRASGNSTSHSVHVSEMKTSPKTTKKNQMTKKMKMNNQLMKSKIQAARILMISSQKIVVLRLAARSTEKNNSFVNSNVQKEPISWAKMAKLAPN